MFDHADFDRFLKRVVDSNGRVDYAAARNDRADLDRYLSALAEASPDTHPGRFPSEAHRLAYWINAYNASAIALVLRYYPIESVHDIRALGPFSFLLPRGAGFFLFRRVVLGGATTTLYGLENVVIRRRFDEPRIHFALNCASIGCPRLPARAFTAEALEDELARETARFFAERRNLGVDAPAGETRVSSILDWYDGDFERWVAMNHPELEASVRTYVRLHAPAEVRAILDDCSNCELEFVPYDWRLNAQGAPGA